MSRSGYNDDCGGWALICWRGAVARAIAGKRGQAFLYEMLHAMAALPERKLIDGELEQDGAVCALGAVGKARGIDMSGIEVDDRDQVAEVFGIAPALAAEIVWMNDEAYWRGSETPEHRFERMRQWIEEQIFASGTQSPEVSADGK